MSRLVSGEVEIEMFKGGYSPSVLLVLLLSPYSQLNPARRKGIKKGITQEFGK